MSQYPHAYGYGQYHGQHVPPPYASQNPSGYTVPGPTPPFSAAAQVHRDAAQAAYESNAMSIPGLGIGGAAPTTNYPSFAPGTPGWNQQPSFSKPAPASALNLPHSQLYQAAPSRFPISQPEPVTGSLSSQPAAVPARPTKKSDFEIEEGELSEGQFEDLYEPRESVPEAPPHPVLESLRPAGPSLPESAADTPDGGFYGSDEDDGGKESRDNEGRDRSASYSPFLSPREPQDEISTPPVVADKSVPRGPPRPAVDVPNSAVPDRRPTVQGLGSNGLVRPAESVSRPQNDPLSGFKSLQEAKKEAQKAILRLWPLGVKYQSYIDEGFDEKVIKALFHDLHLDMPKPTAEVQLDRAQRSESREEGEVEATEPSPPSGTRPQSLVPVSKEPSARGEQSDKGEERKDRIARLLAAKAAKVPLPPKPPAPVPAEPKQTFAEPSAQEGAKTSSGSAPPKGKTWGEKERLIQQKIAALQKSRETQAQKSAGDTARPKDTPANTNGVAVSRAASTDSPASASITTGPRPTEAPPPTVAVEPAPPPPHPPLPGLALSSNVQPNSSAQRKRPVAADFVEYSSSSAPAKRPFGQGRTETSLIIDVSDESDDEEMDIDMDMESPADESTSFQTSGASGQRGPAIRDFPPLTDTFTQRQFSSPAPSVTPPNGIGIKRRETELDMKEKAIQEMRRKIALAEARRKVKQATGGSVTPRPGASSSDLKETDAPPVPDTDRAGSVSSLDRLGGASSQLTPEPSSGKLPKPSQVSRLDPLQRAERRGRLVSLEIPRVESSLKEKLDQLQRLQDEQARLQAEIERSFAEKKKLADELQGLVITPAESPQPNGLDSAPESAAEELSAGQEEPRSSALQGDAASAQALSVSPVPSTSASERSRETGDVSERAPDSSKGASLPLPDVSAEPGPEPPTDESAPGPDASVNGSSDSQEFSGPSAEAGATMPAPADIAGDVQSTPPLDEPVENKSPAPGLTEQAAIAGADEATPMELDSRSPSVEAAEAVSGVDTADETTGIRQASASLPDQISSVAQPREAVQEIESEATGEVPREAASKSAGTLTPYESPLRYFHAYRFHPEYQRAVAGGLKSLTYSNRIDPDRELCPFELNGEPCPPNCEFQHFVAISPPDDQILLELGNPDDYSGEEKSRFIRGLRELLQKFKADKVKDFDTIARGIIEFRAQLLGDRSKVLRLDGVTI